MKKLLLLLLLCFFKTIAAQIITTVAGDGTAGYNGDGAQATTAKLNEPCNVSFDVAGNMHVADVGNYCIRKISPMGLISTFAGNGAGGYSGDGGLATAAQFNEAYSTCFDVVGNMYIADFSNNRIRKVNTNGYISTFAGNGTAGYSGDGGNAISAELKLPSALCFDAIGNLYIADEGNNCIRKVSTNGIITTVAGNGTQGFSGDGGAATAAALYAPTSVCFDALGDLYIADHFNYRIRKVSTTGIISTVVGTGTAGFSGDGGSAIAAEVNFAMGISFDAANNLYIADYYNNRIRKVDNGGIINTFAGTGATGFSGDGGLATLAELNRPIGVTVDASGNLYISDSYNNRIRAICNSTNGRISSNAQFSSIDALCTVTGIEEYNTNSISVYPNPNNGTFTIEDISTEKQTLQLYDVNGRLVLTQTINDKAIIDASCLNEGVYNLNIISNDGVINKKLVIVK